MAKKESLWKSEDIEKLRFLNEKGYTPKQISKELGRTINSVVHKRYEIGLHPPYYVQRPYSDNEFKKIIELLNSGHTQNQIAKIIGRTYLSVKQVIFKIKHGFNPINEWKNEEIEKLKNYVLSKKPFRHLVKELNKPRRIIIKKIEELGLKCKIKSTWARQEMESILLLLNKGHSIYEISLALNRGPYSIIDKIKKIGLRNKYPQIKEFLFSRKNISLEKIFEKCLGRVKNRAKNKGWEFQLTVDYLVKLWQDQDGKCYYTGLDLTIRKKQRNTYSIDRIDSNKGYIDGNVCFCCASVNRMKMDKSLPEFLFLCNKITNYQSENLRF